jgi:hypothetical protein
MTGMGAKRPFGGDRFLRKQARHLDARTTTTTELAIPDVARRGACGLSNWRSRLWFLAVWQMQGAGRTASRSSSACLVRRVGPTVMLRRRVLTASVTCCL